MTLDKQQVVSTLRRAALDATASPYLALQLDGFKVRRTSASSLIVSTGFSAPDAYTHLEHCLDCCKVLGDKISLSLDNGTLCLSGVDLADELRVHTVREDQAGLKTHDVGGTKLSLDANAFQGLDIKPFKLAVPPVLKQGRMLLATTEGLVFWTGPETLRQIAVSPREGLLRFVGGQTLEGLILTDKGYWGAVSSGLLMFSASHNYGQPLFDSYQVDGNLLAELPAQRLVFALRSAASLCGPSDRIVCHSDITTQDRFGNAARFSLGVKTGPAFSILPKTAELIASAFAQSKEDLARLYSIPLGMHSTMRCTRGNFEVDFKVF